MKRKYILLAFVAVSAFFATSCNDFLDKIPDNRTELDNADKIRKILVSAYPESTFIPVVEYMSDNHDDTGAGSAYNAATGPFLEQVWKWQEITEIDNDSPSFIWEGCYGAISHANQALQAIEELGFPASLNPERGEALMARAYAHFVLVNLFCQHYSEEHSATDLGIPYMEAPETKVNPYYSRGTVKEVYEKIDRDIQMALPLIDDAIYTVPKYHFNRAAAHAFAAEFYLFYRTADGTNLDKVIAYATQALGDKPEAMVRDVSGYNGSADRALFYMDAGVNSNLLLMTTYGNSAYIFGAYATGKRYMHTQYLAQTETQISNSILWQAEGTTQDGTFIMRPESYQTTPSIWGRQNYPVLFQYTDRVAGTGLRRTVTIAASADNALLNRAEAYILKEDYTAAMQDINLWVRMRVKAGVYQVRTADEVANYYGGLAYYKYDAPTVKKELNPEIAFDSDKQRDMIHAILHIRRLEFIGEGKRWFDVKRYGIEIERREHVSGSKVNVLDNLKLRDVRRAVQLPQTVIAAGMTPNPR